MRKTAEAIAIYSRKSKFTGKGESIGNQVELCREYVRNFFGEEYAERRTISQGVIPAPTIQSNRQHGSSYPIRHRTSISRFSFSTARR